MLQRLAQLQLSSPNSHRSAKGRNPALMAHQWHLHMCRRSWARAAELGRRLIYMKYNCMCPVNTWPCQHMADAEAGSDGEMSDTSGPASDPLMAHYAVHTAEVGGNE